MLVSEILPNQRDTSRARTYYQAAIEKYREQYRRGKESAWPGLPLLMADEYSNYLMVEEGQHRVMAAILEGATSILADVIE